MSGTTATRSPAKTPHVAPAATTALRGFDRSLPMALMGAREAVMRRFRPILAEHDLTEQQWRVLRALTDADAPLSVGDLAHRTFLLGPSLSRMLVSLEDRSLIARVTADDARRAEIRIAPLGRGIVAEVAPASEEAYADIEAQFDPGELDRLHDVLGRLADSAGTDRTGAGT